MTDLSREEINNIVEDCKESIALDQYSIKDIAIIQMHRESLSLPSVITQLEQEDLDIKFIEWVNDYFENPKTEIYYRRKTDGKKISQSEMIRKYKRAFLL